ncbi:hypothetical protein MBLNU459_g4107t1 [Dothideomycetes sp. NU459]
MAPDASKVPDPETTDSEKDTALQPTFHDPKQPTSDEADVDGAAAASDIGEDETIRANNAYPGAHNTIGSVHQRYWFLTLDRQSSGFVKARTVSDGSRWISSKSTDKRNGNQVTSGFEPFFVRGRDYERSVVTGRLAADVMDDEGIKRYEGRKMWRPIME